VRQLLPPGYAPGCVNYREPSALKGGWKDVKRRQGRDEKWRRWYHCEPLDGAVGEANSVHTWSEQQRKDAAHRYGQLMFFKPSACSPLAGALSNAGYNHV
jgi:hypothetical protein